MKLYVEKDYDAMSRRVAAMIIEEMNYNPRSVLGMSTGGTPMGTYELLIKAYEEKKIDFSRIKTFNCDEYIGLHGEDPNSYRYFMNNNLFNHVNVDTRNTYIPDGRAKNLQAYCKAYDNLIESFGGIDLQLLGIGTNGHIAFNEPAEELSLNTFIAQLDESTIKSNSRFFDSIEDVPTSAISMGMGSIMKANKIIMLANGKNKAEAINRLLESELVTGWLPASFLHLHTDVTLVIDEEAFSLCDERTLYKFY